MDPAVLVVLLCSLAALSAGLSARQSRTDEGRRSKPPWWLPAVLCSVALVVAVVVVALFLHR